MQKPLKYNMRRKDTGGYGSDLFSKSSSKRQNCLRIRTAVVVFATRAPKHASNTASSMNLLDIHKETTFEFTSANSGMKNVDHIVKPAPPR